MKRLRERRTQTWNLVKVEGGKNNNKKINDFCLKNMCFNFDKNLKRLLPKTCSCVPGLDEKCFEKVN
jgi:hypothetical protein